MHGKSTLRSPMKSVRGLGSAHEGTGHFWVQRVTAVALIPLSVWFMVEVITNLLGADRNVIAFRFRSPLVAMAMAAFLVAMVWHARIGIQVIIEDYVHHEGKKIALLLFTKTLAVGLIVASLFAIARLHFIGI